MGKGPLWIGKIKHSPISDYYYEEIGGKGMIVRIQGETHEEITDRDKVQYLLNRFGRLDLLE